MKNICKNCRYYTVLKAKSDTVVPVIVGTSCNLPLSVFLEHSRAGLYDKDTENTCYDFKAKEKEKELCKKCQHYAIIKDKNGNMLDSICDVDIHTWAENFKQGLYKNDTENTCYDFKEKEHIDENE